MVHSMTWGDNEVYFVKNPNHYMMKGLRAIICPNGTVLLMKKEELKLVPTHLASWGLPIAMDVQDQ